MWRGKVTDTVNGIGQSEKQANQAAKDLVKQFMKDAKKVDKNLKKSAQLTFTELRGKSPTTPLALFTREITAAA